VAPAEDWEERVAELWATFDERDERGFAARMESLAGERPEGDPVALFELASAYDSVGREEEAASGYRRALAGGLADDRRRRAVIQLASTLRNLGRPDESVSLLVAERESGSDELDDALAAFLALALADLGRERDAAALALGALSRHLPRYNRSLEAYARALAGTRGRPAVEEAPLERTEHGFAPRGEGWFVLNARDARWRHADGRSAICAFEGETAFSQLGLNLSVLRPGEAMARYHWEADQEDFLVLAGEALLLVEGEERPLRRWDLAHCPAGTRHTIVGAGDAPCVVLAVGARDRSTGPAWGGYPVDDTALRHRAGVERETTEPREAYAHLPQRRPTAYRDGWLP
jgi:uncharacterized cupin superfamily protein